MKLNYFYIIRKRFCFTSVEIKQNESLPKNYESIVKQRNKESEKTVFITHPSCPKKLLDYAVKFGNISNFFTFRRSDKHYALIEYQNIIGSQKLLQSARHFPNNHRIPYSFGKCLYFHAYANLNSKKQSNQKIFNVEDRVINDDLLLNCADIDSQMKLLHKLHSMSELDIRLKYFLASEIEAVARCIFPDSKICLFGSSVNGLGRFNGDADMMLKIENDNRNQFGHLNEHPLYYMSRIRPEEPKQFSKHVLGIIGGIISYIVPQMMNVRRILRARVPIIKFVHSPTEIECDICLNNNSAIEMSRILFKLITMDIRFSLLIFALRQWARCNQVTSPHPGPWLSNFMITMLVLFRFQNIKPPIFPPLNKIQTNGKDTKYDFENLFNNMTLENLLLDFFSFYAIFDFDVKGISLLNGQYIEKPDSSVAIYIENPLEPELNICKNVDTKHLDIFKKACISALKNLEIPYASNKFGILNILSLIDPQEDLLRDSCEYYTDLDENGKVLTNEGSPNG